jgi:hypothetical protein
MWSLWKMKRNWKILIAVFVLTGIMLVNAQSSGDDVEIDMQLQRLETKLQSARYLAKTLNSPELFQLLEQATAQYHQARLALESGQRIRAVNHIKRSYLYLTQFYQNFKANELFRQRFKERLDRQIEEAERIVSQSQDGEGIRLLNRAKFYRERAYQMFRSDNPEAMFRNYFIAIFFAESASRIASGQDMRDARDFNRYLEDSKELLSQLDELSSNANNEMSIKIIQNARTELGNVQKLYDQGQYKQAYQKLQIVNRFLYRALDLLESNPNAISDRLEVDLQLLEDRLSDLRDEIRLQDDESIQKMYERSIFLASGAEEKFSRQDYNGARQQISMANRLLFQIHRRINHTTDVSGERLKNQFETGQVMLDALRNEEIDNPVYPQLLELLEDNYNNAQLEYQKGNVSGALQYMQIFNRLAVRINQLKKSPEVEQQENELSANSLQRLETMLKNVDQQNSKDEIQQAKFTNARKLYQIADESHKKGNFELSIEISHFALNLLTQ